MAAVTFPEGSTLRSLKAPRVLTPSASSDIGPYPIVLSSSSPSQSRRGLPHHSGPPGALGQELWDERSRDKDRSRRSDQVDSQLVMRRLGGYDESFAPERRAPMAERGVRSLKGVVSTHVPELRESGVEIPDGEELHEVLGLLFSYAAHCHN